MGRAEDDNVSGAPDGELARVARGRLEWLTQHLRAQLSLELASALREADPLAAADGADRGGEGGGGGGRSAEGLAGADEERRREKLVRVQVRGTWGYVATCCPAR